MLGLDVQEQSQLHSLESSLSNTVNHEWPILHVHFIDEPISNWDIKEQGDLTTENQKHPLPQTDIVNIAELQKPELTSCTGSQDCRGNYSLNSAVMLGTVDAVAPMDISSATQKMDRQELVGSPVQGKEDSLEIGINPEVSVDWHIKDNQTLGDPDKAVYMEDISTEIGLQSAQNAKQDNMQPERNKYTDVKESNSSDTLTEVCVVMETKLKDSFEQPPGGPEECTVVTSSEHTCLANDLRDGGSCMCLEDQEVPLCSCTSHKSEPDANDINTGPASFLSTSPKGSMTENSTRPKENCLEHAVQNVVKSKDICVPQTLDMTSCTESKHRKDCLCKPFSNTHLVGKVGNSLEDSDSQNMSDLLSECGKCINFPVVMTKQPNLQTSIERPSAKSCDPHECSFIPNTREYNIQLQSGSADSPEEFDCVKNLPYKLDESSDSCSIDLVSAKNKSVESAGKDTTNNLLADDNEMAVAHFRNSDTTIKIKEQFQVVENFQAKKVSTSSHDGIMTQAMHSTILQTNQLPSIVNEAQSPVAYCSSRMPERHSVLPNLGRDAVKSCSIATGLDSAMGTKNDKSGRQQADIHIVTDVSEFGNVNEIAELDSTGLFSHGQSLASNKTIFSSHHFKEVHCQEPPPECQAATNLPCPLEITLQNALVPYVDIWSFLTKPRGPDVLYLNSTNNIVLKKAKCQKLELRNDFSYDKLRSFLYTKARSVLDRLPSWKDEKRALVVHSYGHLDSVKTLLLKCPNDKFKVPKHLFHGQFASSHKVKKSDGVPRMLPTITQTNWVSSSGSEAVNVMLSACSSVDDIRSLDKPTLHTQVKDYGFQKNKTLVHPQLSSSHIVQSAPLPTDIMASGMEHTQRMKLVVPIKPMITRSRNKIQCKGPSEYVHTLKPAKPALEDSTTEMQSILLGEQRPPFKLLKRSPPEMGSGTLKRKKLCIKTKNTLPINNNKPLPLQHKQLPKDCIRQPTCHMEMKVIREDKSIENLSLKLEPQSLTCTIQGTKRPKTSHDNCGLPSNSGLQGCIDSSSHKTLSLHPPSQRPSCKIQKVPELPRNNYMTGDISLRRQPSRKCKSSFIQGYNVPISNIRTSELSKAFHAHTCHRLLTSKRAGPKMTSNTLYAKVIKKDVATFNKYTAEQALLHQLSAIAGRLTAPCRNSVSSMPLSNTTKLVPFKGVQLQARKLLNVFSCVNMRISSQSAGSVGFSSSRDYLLSQSMDLQPAPLTKVCPDFLGSSYSLPNLDNPTFPVSFHMKVDPGLLSDFIKYSPPDYMFKSALPITQSAQLSEWTLSFFLSPHFPATSDGIKLFTHWNPHFKFLGPPKSDSSCSSKSERMTGCSMLGLHTVLALSSPGCYRLWTRKRNLGSRIPTVQKLSVTQFAHGLKGLPPQFSWKREISSSFAFALGRVMSVWSRHGLSAFSSDFATPHPHCSSWQPSQSLSISLPVLKPSTDLIPKNCFKANEARHQFNVSSWQEKYFRPSHCISALSKHATCLFLEEGGGLRSSCSLFNNHGKHDKPLHCLPSPQQENLFCLSTEKIGAIGPPQSLSIEQSNELGHLHCLSIEQDDVVEPPNFLSIEQAKNLSIDSLHLLSTGQGEEIGPSSCLSVQQEDALKLPVTHSLPLDNVNTCEPPCQLSPKQDDGFGPSCSGVSIEHHSGIVPLCNLSNKQHSDIKPQHYLIAHQDVPQLPHCLTIEQRMGLGHTKVLSNEQGDGPESSRFLSPQQADCLGASPSLSTQRECEFGPCNLPILEPPCVLVPSKIQARPFEQRESLPIPHAKTENQNLENEKEGERKPQRVSQIRIRKTIPKPDPNLTPMGLPKPKRINKKEFSLEDIYTNKNYKSPPPARSLETIFEEPKEKNGVLVSVSQTKRKRILEFRDCTMPRPKRAKGKVRVMNMCKRGRKAAMEGVQLDALLIQKLMDLENFLLEQETLERGSAAVEKPS